jgi:hypothetical protein
MSSKYNRNYPIQHKVEHGVLLSMDGIKIAQEYLKQCLLLDVSPSAKIEAAGLINLCIGDLIAVKYVNIASVRIRVNFYMAINQFAPENVLKLICSFIETILFQAQDYRGFNNYVWSHGGSSTWHDDYPNHYGSDEDFQIAQKAMSDSKYQSQEYHRIYY